MEGVKTSVVVLSVVVLVVACFGIILGFSANHIFDMILRRQIILSPNSMTFSMWANMTKPMKTSIYIFNVTNLDEVFYKNGKPILQEVGPYVFDEYHEKVKIYWNANTTVTYQQRRKYIYRPDLSSGDWDKDMVTIINPPAATIAAMVYGKSNLGVVDLGLKIIGEKLFVTKTPREILFDGYNDPILTAEEFLKDIGIHFPTDMSKFGFFFARNMSETYDGIFNMKTGAYGLGVANHIVAWNYSDRIKFFPGPCGIVRGSGDLFSPYLPRSEIQMFNNDLFRPLELQYEGRDSFMGVPGYGYGIHPSFFANASQNPKNWCYSGTNGVLGHEIPSGVYNMTGPYFGCPVFISQPHFFQADPFYRSFVDGDIKPNATKHRTHFIVEPLSGIPLQVMARFQMNILVTPNNKLSLMGNIGHEIFFPAVWFEINMDLDETLSGQMWLLAHLVTIFKAVGFGLCGLGLGSVIVLGLFFKARARNSEESTRFLVSEESTEDVPCDTSSETNQAVTEPILATASNGVQT